MHNLTLSSIVLLILAPPAVAIALWTFCSQIPGEWIAAYAHLYTPRDKTHPGRKEHESG